MSNKAHTTNKTLEEILKSNPAVSKSVVAQYNELEKKLHKLGVDTKPHYTLSPPPAYLKPTNTTRRMMPFKKD